MHNAPMKRIVPPILLLSLAALAGCQTIKAHNPFRHREPPYESARQEPALKIPPRADQPSTTEALVIPGAGAGDASALAATSHPQQPVSEAPPPANIESEDTLSLADAPANAYQRVGQALARTALGKVTAHDDAAHTYQFAVDTTVKRKSEGGFFHRLFHRRKTVRIAGTVTVSVAAQGNGSVVRVSGDPEAATSLMQALKQGVQ